MKFFRFGVFAARRGREANLWRLPHLCATLATVLNLMSQHHSCAATS